MTMASGTPISSVRKLEPGKERQARVAGTILIALALLTVFVLAPDASGNATFRLSRPTDAIVLPNLVVPGGAFIYFAAAILGFLGARQFVRAQRTDRAQGVEALTPDANAQPAAHHG